jgi:hypothetical protein
MERTYSALKRKDLIDPYGLKSYDRKKGKLGKK